MAIKKNKARKDAPDVLHQLTQTLRAIDLKQKDVNEKGMTNEKGEFVHYKGLPTMMSPFPAGRLLEIVEQGKKGGKLRMTREEFEWLCQLDVGDHGEPDGVSEPIEIEIVYEDDAK